MGNVTTRYPQLRPDDRLGDLLSHPAFRGFSSRMLPWDGRVYDPAMPLKDIDQLLPYHRHVEPTVVVAALNRMVDDANAGRTVFYDFYTNAQRQAQPALQNTGLFFFRGEPGAPFASIAPRARLPDTGLSMEADQERRPFDRVTEWLAHVPSSN